MDRDPEEPRYMRARNGNHANGRDGGRPEGHARTTPAHLTAESNSLLRPETQRLLREFTATPAIFECPVSLTREEARSILGMIETRWVVSRAWARTIEWALRYACIAQQLASRAGFPAYARWIQKHRIDPMRVLHGELTDDTLGRDGQSDTVLATG